jgi:hypothetical protein
MTNTDTEKLLVELAEFKRSRFFGKYNGFVEDVDDPEKLGRITAIVPDIYGKKIPSPWALPCVPFAGPNHGLVVLPEKGDGVWIEFRAGDLRCPIWTGFYWAKNEMPAPGRKATLVLVTKGGHKIILDDGPVVVDGVVDRDPGELKLLHSKGAEFTMAKDSITLKIGTTQIVISKNGVNINNGAFEVK